MKRTSYDSEYERIRREAGMAKPQLEFSEQRNIDSEAISARIRDLNNDFRERMEIRNQYEIEQSAKRKAEATALTLRANDSLRLTEFARAGVEPPSGLPVSLSLLFSIEWTIEEIDNQKVLVMPKMQKRKTREEYAAESVKDSF